VRTDNQVTMSYINRMRAENLTYSEIQKFLYTFQSQKKNRQTMND
jgi:hypothetical protein